MLRHGETQKDVEDSPFPEEYECQIPGFNGECNPEYCSRTEDCEVCGVALRCVENDETFRDSVMLNDIEHCWDCYEKERK